MSTIRKKLRVIAIVGPTASGKSDLAVELARRFDGEVISADSRQVYRGLTIGTDKVPGKWKKIGKKKVFVYKGIPHHLIDFVNPKHAYTAAEFQEKTRNVIADINARDKLPIIAGGTGFWIDAALTDTVFPAVPPNPILRARLAKKTPAQLLAILAKIDPRRAKTVEQKNPRRLIRAIEIATSLGSVPRLKPSSPYRVLWLGIARPQGDIDARIHVRATRMIRKGLLRETKKILSHGVSRLRIRELGFEYYLAFAALDKKINSREFIEKLTRETRKYSKRQMTWFKRNKAIAWIKNPREAAALTKVFIRQR